MPQQAPCCIFPNCHRLLFAGPAHDQACGPLRACRLESWTWPTAEMHVSVIGLDVHTPACSCSSWVARLSHGRPRSDRQQSTQIMRMQVSSATGKDQLSEALYGCDLVVIPAGVPRKPGMTRDDLFNINAGLPYLVSLLRVAAAACYIPPSPLSIFDCHNMSCIPRSWQSCMPLSILPVTDAAHNLDRQWRIHVCDNAADWDTGSLFTVKAVWIHQFLHAVACCRHSAGSMCGRGQVLPPGLGGHHLKPSQLHCAHCSRSLQKVRSSARPLFLNVMQRHANLVRIRASWPELKVHIGCLSKLDLQCMRQWSTCHA